MRNEEAKVLLKVAGQDQKAFELLIGSRKISLSVACFHAQQTVEKSIKAVLAFKGISFRRTHDLTELCSLLIQNRVGVPFSQELLARLNPYAVVFRYDDTEIEVVGRKEVLDFVAVVYKWAKKQTKVVRQ